jgi:hypothetical protein
MVMNYYIQRISSDSITSLEQDEVFVFGSNQSGRHGKGAAKVALRFGAKNGQADGLQGKSYGIPTKNASITKTLSIATIAKYIDTFTQVAKANPNKKFLVTPIGCGLAGLNPKDVAPLFKEASLLSNVYLPKVFWVHL